MNTKPPTTKGGEIVPYVYGLIGFFVTLVLVIIVLQLLL
jgi:hypothetical protein